MHLWHSSQSCFETSQTQTATVTDSDKPENSTVVICDFVTICDQCYVVVKWIQSHWQHVLCIWERTPKHFWHEYEKLRFSPLCRYLICIRMCVWVWIWIIMTKPKYQGNHLERLEWLCKHVLCSYVFNPHKLRQSQIATYQKILPSKFVILSPIVIRDMHVVVNLVN